MRSKCVLSLLALLVLGAAVAEASVLRVVVVETSDVAAYAQALAQGQALLKSKGSQVTIRVWKAQYAGPEAGTVVISAEYPSFEALAQDDARLANDPELRAWLQSLDGLRKIVSDSIYREVAP